MGKKIIISCAITGSVHTPTMSRYLPVTPDDIARQAIDAANAGAASVHIHARDPNTGKPSSDLGLFCKIIEKIKSKSDVIICTTTGGAAGMDVDERLSVVPEFRPELASFNMGSMNFGVFQIVKQIKEWNFDWEKDYLEASKSNIFRNTFCDLERICQIMNKCNTKPELEIYDTSHLYNASFLLKKGLLKPPLYLQFVTGILGGIGSTIYDLVHLKSSADRLFGEGNYNWSAFGAGKDEFPICTHAVLMGGNCRVGMEDNLYLNSSTKVKNNAEMVEKMLKIIGEFGLDPANPDEAREMLNIKTEEKNSIR